MNTELIKKIDELVDADYDNIVKDVIELVNIKSVRGEPLPGAPFGEGPKKVLDRVLEIGEERGLIPRVYKDTGVVSLALDEGDIDLGIWIHGDVVPEGDGWDFEPYNAVEYKGRVIGRGATDNKGQLVATLRILQIFKQLGIKLNYIPAMYVGSNEETGMGDMIGVPGNDDAKGFVNLYKCPKLSLVPDGGFPMGYGGKGGMYIWLRAKKPFSGVEINAGLPESPGRAVAIVNAKQCPELTDCTVECGEKVTITAESAPKHLAHPDPNGNMITLITKGLLQSGLLCEEDKKMVDFLRRISLDVEGEMFGVKSGGGVTGDLTLATKDVIMHDGKAEICINIRYPIEITFDEIVERMARVSADNGFEVSRANRGVNPYLNPCDTEVVLKLTEIANSITGWDQKPYTVGGGTYAHRLPNAYVYGMSGCFRPEGFPADRGGAHGKDELVSVFRLQNAMKIYARAMLALNEMEQW
ncbi:MAG: Sapep family Mn(2+)-dependent dipeptidase [Clostridia bacterium]|nr:Sapep family Mn(2+)-dependent dipeptidase [Clostridia bacterium]